MAALQAVRLLALALLALSMVLYLVLASMTMDAGTSETPAPSVPATQFRDAPRRQVANGTQTTLGAEDVSSPDGALLHWLRRQRHEDTVAASSADLSQLLSRPLHFVPGTLPLSQLAALQHCYADPAVYRAHFKEGVTRRVPYSERHQLAYVLLPKSGSSTGRFMMQHEFGGDERQVLLAPPLNVVAFIREPLGRFYSQYDEAYARTAPWSTGQNVFQVYPDGGAARPHPFPFLFAGLRSYADYQDVFCPPATRRDPRSARECVHAASRENGTLAERLERFVREYDGRSPFDVHLALQVPLLSDVSTGRALPVTELYNTTDAERDWQAIAKRYLGEEAVLENARKMKLAQTGESGGVIRGRSYPRRFDKGLVGRATERRICELALLDYCCLNFPLPELGEDGGGTDLSCKMDYSEGRIRIQPGIIPDKAT